MKTRKALTSLSDSRAVTVACWIVYMAAYITRNTFPAAIVHLTGAGLLSQSEAGLISSGYFILYGIGHFINGFLADRISPVKMLTVGICGTVVANAAMIFVTPSIPLMALVWWSNGWFESMLWAPIVALLSSMIAPSVRVKAMKAISSSRSAGMITAYLLTAVSAYFNFGIVTPYIIAAVCAALTCVLLAVVVKRAFSSPDVVDAAFEKKTEKGGNPVFKLLFVSGALVFAVPAVFHGMLKEGVKTWVPSFLHDSFNTAEALSTLLAIAVPVAGLLGVFFANFLLDIKFLHKNHSVIGIVLMLMTGVPTALLLAAKRLPLAVGVVCLCLISLLMEAFNHIFSVMMPTEFAKYGKASTVSGIFNSLIYTGSAVSIYAFGAVAERAGWSFTVIIWTVLALLSAVILLFVIKRWGSFIGTGTKNNLS